MVLAWQAVAFVSTFAALPVDASSTKSFSRRLSSLMKVLTRVVFPVPAYPLRT